MRGTWLAAGLVMVAACGGGEKKAEAPAAPATPAATAAAPAGTGTVHVIDMTLNGANGVYSPSSVTIKVGDIVRFVNKEGGPHNISFWPDSQPAGGKEFLATAMKDQMAPLESQLEVEQGKTYDISFAGAPVGTYRFYCLPHLAMGMHGSITVTK